MSSQRKKPEKEWSPQTATDAEWEKFERNVRWEAKDPNLDVAQMFDVVHRMKQAVENVGVEFGE